MNVGSISSPPFLRSNTDRLNSDLKFASGRTLRTVPALHPGTTDDPEPEDFKRNLSLKADFPRQTISMLSGVETFGIGNNRAAAAPLLYAIFRTPSLHTHLTAKQWAFFALFILSDLLSWLVNRRASNSLRFVAYFHLCIVFFEWIVFPLTLYFKCVFFWMPSIFQYLCPPFFLLNDFWIFFRHKVIFT